MQPSFNVFNPTDGAVLDAQSLSAIAAIPQDILGATLDMMSPNTNNIVLNGLEVVGDLAAGGPPGARRPDARSVNVRLSPGSAIVSDIRGRKFLIRIEEETRVPWPSRKGSKVFAALVLMAETHNPQTELGLTVAREIVSPKFGFVDVRLLNREHYLPLAVAVGNSQDWATDYSRIYEPEHEIIGLLLKRFEKLERTVWQAEPEGGVWDREVLGKNWFRYQTVGAAALQAARAMLMSYPTTTMDRVRLLKTLRDQLHSSVEQASTELLQLIGSRDAAGPYIDVLPHTTGG